ncbi:MAG: hypothetical protein QXK06_05245 [Candidatus Diapherotrites archaeon]
MVLMKPKHALIVLAAFLAILFLSGCMQPPLENTQTINFYKFKLDGSFESGTEMTGTLTSAADEWTDCQAKISSLFDMIIAFSQMQTDLNAEQKQQIENLKKIKEMIKCEFVQDKQSNTGKFTLYMLVTEQNMSALEALAQKEEDKEKLRNMVKKNPDGTIEVNMELAASTQTSSLNLGGQTPEKPKEIRFFIEGEVLEFTPQTYAKEEGYYSFKDPATLEGQKIHIKYGQPVMPLFSFMGIDFTMETLLIASGAIFLLLIIIIALLFLKGKKKKTVEQPKPAQSTAFAQTERDAEIRAEKERIAREMQAATERQQQMVFETKKPQPPLSPAKPAAAVQGSEEAKIERLVLLLKPKAKEYTSREIKEAIIAEGYSEAIASEVLKRLGV